MAVPPVPRARAPEGALDEHEVLEAQPQEPLVVVEQRLAQRVERLGRSGRDVERGEPLAPACDPHPAGGGAVGVGERRRREPEPYGLRQVRGVQCAEGREVVVVAQAGQHLDLAELHRLGAARRAQVGPELVERPRRHVLEHPQLAHDRVDDVVDPPEQHDGCRPRVVVDRGHDPAQVVEDELEPQLDRLVGDDEVQLLGMRRLAAQALQVEQLGDPQIAGVVDLGVVHGSIMAPERAAGTGSARPGAPDVSRRLGGVARGDGRLIHDLLPGEKGPQDACGVFGVWAPGEEVAKLTYFGLYALQHRGQESAGIAVSDGRQILVYKDMGLVSQVFDEATSPRCAATSPSATAATPRPASSVWENAQPTFRATATGSIALGHNGNLTNTRELAELVDELPRPRRAAAARRHRGCAPPPTPTWSPRCSPRHPDLSLEAAALEVLPPLRGAFSLVFMDETTLYAARDPQGIRPLVLGRLERGWVVASETAALDIVGASLRPRDRARRAHRHRRARAARPSASPRPSPRAACSSTSTWPARTPRSPAAASTPPGSRSAAGSRVEAPGRGRPGHPGARVGHPGRGRLRRGVAASRTARAW